VEPCLKTSYQEGLFSARTLVQDQQEVPVRIMNNIDQDQGLAEGTTLGSSQPVTRAAPVNCSQPQTPGTGCLNGCKWWDRTPDRTSVQEKPKSWRTID
jgi:hypothetical protein